MESRLFMTLTMFASRRHWRSWTTHFGVSEEGALLLEALRFSRGTVIRYLCWFWNFAFKEYERSCFESFRERRSGHFSVQSDARCRINSIRGIFVLDSIWDVVNFTVPVSSVLCFERELIQQEEWGIVECEWVGVREYLESKCLEVNDTWWTFSCFALEHYVPLGKLFLDNDSNEVSLEHSENAQQTRFLLPSVFPDKLLS